MHEFSIADSMITTIKGQLKPGQQVVSVTITLGPLSGISADSLTFCFTELAAQANLGTPALMTNRSKARLRCTGCTTEYEVTEFFTTCPVCGSLERVVLSGCEFTLDSMEVEEDYV